MGEWRPQRSARQGQGQQGVLSSLLGWVNLLTFEGETSVVCTQEDAARLGLASQSGSHRRRTRRTPWLPESRVCLHRTGEVGLPGSWGHFGRSPGQRRATVGGSQLPRRLRRLQGQGGVGLAGAVDMSGRMSEPGMEEQDSHLGGRKDSSEDLLSSGPWAQCSALNGADCASPRGHLEMFGDIFGCQCWRWVWGVYHGVWWVETRDAAQLPTTQKTAPYHLALNVICVVDVKPWDKGRSFLTPAHHFLFIQAVVTPKIANKHQAPKAPIEHTAKKVTGVQVNTASRPTSQPPRPSVCSQVAIHLSPLESPHCTPVLRALPRVPGQIPTAQPC